MPYKTEKIRFDCPFFDRRTKLLPCQKERMTLLHKQGYSQRKLASIFNVSRRLVQFVTCPEKKEENLQRRTERGGSKIYYKGGKEWADTVKAHRKYKHSLLKNTVNNGSQKS